MVSTYTTALNIEKPGSGDYVGTWDSPVNSNMDIVDAVGGQSVTISLGAANVILSAAQFRCGQIVFNSTLSASVTITFPSTFTKPYTIYHACYGSSAYTITLQTTVAGGQVICAKPGEPFDIWNDGTNIRFRNLGNVGSYWDYAGSSVPNWVSGCTVPPYLNCDGTTFSSATYPLLTTILGSTTLPDLRGRVRAYLNQGTGRMTSGSSTGGVDGNTNYASGGNETTTLSSQNIPPAPVTDPGHTHALTGGGSFITSVSNNTFSGGTNGSVSGLNSAVTGISVGSTSPTNFSNIQPTVVGGLSLIRAA